MKFPTMAQKALAAWHAYPGTISLTLVAERCGGKRVRPNRYDNGSKVIEFIFDDDTSLEIRGVGKNHRVECLLP